MTGGGDGERERDVEGVTGSRTVMTRIVKRRDGGWRDKAESGGRVKYGEHEERGGGGGGMRIDRACRHRQLKEVNGPTCSFGTCWDAAAAVALSPISAIIRCLSFSLQ